MKLIVWPHVHLLLPFAFDQGFVDITLFEARLGATALAGFESTGRDMPARLVTWSFLKGLLPLPYTFCFLLTALLCLFLLLLLMFPLSHPPIHIFLLALAKKAVGSRFLQKHVFR